jgi:hypothetical protein
VSLFILIFVLTTLKHTTMEKKITESGKSYWNNNGAYQTEYDKLYEDLVPSRGEADTVHGEMIRSVSRLFYDFCNNGNCNVIEIQNDSCPDCFGSGYEEPEECTYCDGSGTEEVDYGEYEEDGEVVEEICNNCGGSGEEEPMDCSTCGGDCTVNGDIEINGYYQDMINFLKRHLNNTDVVENLVEFLERDDLGYGTYTFNDNEMKVYNNLVDVVVHQILTTENQKRVKKDLVD